MYQPIDPPKESKCKNRLHKFAGILGFIALCFLYGTSYGIAILGLKHFPGATLTAMRMIFAFGSSLLIFILRICFEPEIRTAISISFKKHKKHIFTSAFGGIIYYGFPHSLIGVAQRSIPSNTVHIAQSCVPFFAFIFANFMLDDEKFSFLKFYPQVLALIGTVLTTIPTEDSSYGEKPKLIDYIFIVVAIASFGLGSVYMKSHLAVVEPTICGLYQLLGSAIYSTIFAIAYDKPSVFAEKIRTASFVDMLWPLILGAVHTCGCTYVYLFTCKKLGAVIASFSNFGQIIIGVLIGIFFFNEWDSYDAKDYILSAFGLILLTAAIICGLVGDRILCCKKFKSSIRRDESLYSLQESQTTKTSDLPEEDIPKTPLLLN